MIVFVGDTHGFFAPLQEYATMIRTAGHNNPACIIQVGDFGFYPDLIDREWTDPGVPVYAIDGNHEYFPMLAGIKTPTEIAPNLIYVPRGTIMELFGYRIGFCGGGFSPNKAMLVEGKSWFPEEEVTLEDVQPLLNQELDYLVTHTPPISVISSRFPRLNHKEWGLPADWKDLSAERIQYLWETNGYPRLICGHMHKSVIYGTVRILAEYEVYGIRPKA